MWKIATLIMTTAFSATLLINGPQVLLVQAKSSYNRAHVEANCQFSCPATDIVPVVRTI